MSDEHKINKMPRVYRTVTNNQQHLEERIAIDDAIRDAPSFTFPMVECGKCYMKGSESFVSHESKYGRGRIWALPTNPLLPLKCLSLPTKSRLKRFSTT